MTDHRLIASGSNDNVQVFLDRWDFVTYTVSTHVIGSKPVHEDFDSMTWACKKFFETCHEYGIEPKKAI